jgi:hypothetical protein
MSIEAIFRPEYCFHAPAISGVLLQDPVAGIFDPDVEKFDR